MIALANTLHESLMKLNYTIQKVEENIDHLSHDGELAKAEAKSLKQTSELLQQARCDIVISLNRAIGLSFSGFWVDIPEEEARTMTPGLAEYILQHKESSAQLQKIAFAILAKQGHTS